MPKFNSLWPVNRLGVEGVEALFARNERICAFLATGGGGPADLCLVAIGATLVGSVRVTFDDLATNVPDGGIVDRRYAGAGPRLERGEEWGRFEFGSTIVMITGPGRAKLDAPLPGSVVRLGTRIGTLLTPSV